MSRQRETDFWTLVRGHLPGISERIENVTGTGTPDVHNCTEGVVTWIETKSLVKLELLDTEKPGLKASQRNWHTNYRRHGGRVFILTRVDNSIYVHQFDHLNGFTRIFKTSKPFDWNGLCEILFKQTVFTNAKPGL